MSVICTDAELVSRAMAAEEPTLSTPYADLLPPLSSEEMAALRADIAKHGVRNPVCIDEVGAVLDGHHRLIIEPNAPRDVISGLSAAEKKAFVYRANFTRRNLSHDQRNELRKPMKMTAEELRREDPQQWTNAAVGRELGVSETTVRRWLMPNRQETNGHIPDARMKVSHAARRNILQRVGAGECQRQIAADFGLSQSRVSRLVTAERQLVDAQQSREDAVKQMNGDCGVIHGDFRIAGRDIADESVELIFTDPPYATGAIDLYSSVAEFAERTLIPGGWLLAYSGLANLPSVLEALRVDGLQYGWMFPAIHSGGDSRFRKFHLFQG